MILRFLAAVFGTFVVFFLLFLAGIQTPFVQKKIRSWMVEKAQEEGISLSIGSVRASSPLHWTFKEVCVEKEGYTLFQAEKIHAQLDFLPLFQQKVSIKFSFDEFHWVDQPFYHVEVSLLATHQEEKTWVGEVKMGSLGPFVFTADIPFLLTSEELQFKEIHFSAPQSGLNGSLTYFRKEKAFEGVLYAFSEALSVFDNFAPYLHLGGQLGATLTFKKENHFFETVVHAQNIHLYEMFITSMTMHAVGSDLIPKMTVSAEAERIYSSQAFFSSTSFSMSALSTLKHWTYNLHTQGMWKEPFVLDAQGFWKKEDETHTLGINTLSGSLLESAYALKEPFTFSRSPQEIHLTPLFFRLGEGTVHASFDCTLKQGSFSFKASAIPLETFSLIYPEFPLKGDFSLEASLEKTESKESGSLQLSLQSLKLKGALLAHLSNHTLQLQGHLKAPEEQFAAASATLPVSLTEGCMPEIQIDSEEPFSAELTMEGHLEEIFDFVNMGAQKVQGLLSTRLFLSNTLAHPHVQGSLEIHKGFYENYIIGTTLKNVEAFAIAKHDHLEFTDIHAEDLEKGALSAQGSIFFNPSSRFPYSFAIYCDQFQALRSDLIHAAFTGPMQIVGDTASCTASGSLQVPKAVFTIPEELPIDLPELPVTYIHQPKHTELSYAPPSFAFHTDLELEAQGQLALQGKGLHSLWEGKAIVSGTNRNIAAHGSLHLLKGEYLFSGKRFTLTQGEISFINEPTPAAFLSLNGTLTLQDATITAQLRGPLSSPQLTFQSVPPLPTSSILALILFNKDISDLTAFQALQLAQTLVSLSGGAAPDVLEKIRQSLGVDRLNIVSHEGTEDVSVQIGKYLTSGVLITLSQGTETSDVIVEVELGKGFVFQAETQDEEEGKFSLKWNRNY